MQLQELNLTDASVFEQEVQRRIDESDESQSVFIIDMSGISKIFARSGRAANTAFLSTVAKLLMRACRENDTVCRIGDSAFGVVFEGLASTVLQQLAAEKILRLYDAAIREMDVSYQAEVRIGIANYPEHAGNADELLHNARLALEAALARSEPYLIYSPESVATMALKWSLQDDLAAAIDGKTFDVYYQPKISVETGRVVGAEALLRWQLEEHGQIPPSVFVPLACELGLITELTQFVLTTALRNAAEWPATGDRLGISVNLEEQTLQEVDIEEVVASSLSFWGKDELDLTLEITESVLVAESKSDFSSLKKLRSMGVGISVDDFGTGHSSLSYFQNIPATELKIDTSFTDTMCESTRTLQLVETIISLAHRFDLTVVAEGVESEAQLKLLADMQCDVIQGFHVAEAMPHDAFCKWLESHSSSD